MATSNALVHVRSDDIAPPTPTVEKRVHIEESDAVPRPAVEVVTEEELRHQEQVKAKAKAPETFFERAPEGVPEFPGADVNSETLLGFLAAAEQMVSTNRTHPILSSVKVTYRAGESSKLYIEASGTDLWSVVAVDATSSSSTGFVTMMPLRHAKNAVNAIRLNYKTVTIGMNEDKLCLGPTMVPYGGKIDDFPPQPVLRDWDARAAVPAFYFEEICGRVLPAQSRSTDPTESELRGVLLDFAVHEVEGQKKILCTAIATDGGRMHVLRLPRIQVQGKVDGVMPPAVLVQDKFFRYMRAVANREWTAFEISEEQVTGRGEDYLAVAKATMRGKSGKSVANWRSIDVEHPGAWMVDRKDLERISRAALEASANDEVRLRIDALLETLELCSWGKEGQKFKDIVPARRFDGPPAVQVRLNGRYLMQAVSACRSGLIRLGFAHDLEEQEYTAVVVRGEDAEFKAIVMPIN
jgi:DNA polymerase III sliding clamp (beta) subunit (PCNA family)